MSIQVDQEKVAKAVRLLLSAIGEDPDRDGLAGTPQRVARACSEIFSGMGQDPKQLLSRTFDISHDELVIVKDIDIWSMCEHHLLPFGGRAHVGYIPAKSGQVVGLSKITRLVDLFARRLQVQERLTTQIADSLVEYLSARGVIVVMECEHMCMTMRGIKKTGSKTVTSAVRGLLRNASTRAEAMSLINQS